MNRAAFYVLCYDICKTYACSVTSGIRTPDRNAKVGGLPNSAHLNGFAADLIPDLPELTNDILAYARSKGLDALCHKNHIHIEVDPANQTDG